MDPDYSTSSPNRKKYSIDQDRVVDWGGEGKSRNDNEEDSTSPSIAIDNSNNITKSEETTTTDKKYTPHSLNILEDYKLDIIYGDEINLDVSLSSVEFDGAESRKIGREREEFEEDPMHQQHQNSTQQPQHQHQQPRHQDQDQRYQHPKKCHHQQRQHPQHQLKISSSIRPSRVERDDDSMVSVSRGSIDSIVGSSVYGSEKDGMLSSNISCATHYTNEDDDEYSHDDEIYSDGPPEELKFNKMSIPLNNGHNVDHDNNYFSKKSSSSASTNNQLKQELDMSLLLDDEEEEDKGKGKEKVNTYNINNTSNSEIPSPVPISIQIPQIPPGKEGHEGKNQGKEDGSAPPSPSSINSSSTYPSPYPSPDFKKRGSFFRKNNKKTIFMGRRRSHDMNEKTSKANKKKTSSRDTNAYISEVEQQVVTENDKDLIGNSLDVSNSKQMRRDSGARKKNKVEKFINSVSTKFKKKQKNNNNIDSVDQDQDQPIHQFDPESDITVTDNTFSSTGFSKRSNSTTSSFEPSSKLSPGFNSYEKEDSNTGDANFCDLCHRGFLSQQQLQNHIETSRLHLNRVKIASQQSKDEFRSHNNFLIKNNKNKHNDNERKKLNGTHTNASNDEIGMDHIHMEHPTLLDKKKNKKNGSSDLGKGIVETKQQRDEDEKRRGEGRDVVATQATQSKEERDSHNNYPELLLIGKAGMVDKSEEHASIENSNSMEEDSLSMKDMKDEKEEGSFSVLIKDENSNQPSTNTNLNEWEDELQRQFFQDLKRNDNYSRGLKLFDWKGTEIPFNSSIPIPFENDYFKGEFLFLLNTCNYKTSEGGEVSTPYNEYFKIRKAAMEFQIQGEFKVCPKGTLYMGGEMPFALELGFGLRSMANMCMGIACQFDPMLHFSFGEKEEKSKKPTDSCEKENVTLQKAHVTWPLLTGMDRVIKSSKTSSLPLPKLGGIIPETDEDRSARKSGKQNITLEKGYIYTMAFGCSMVDLIKWKASFGSTSVDLVKFLGQNPLQIVVYDIDTSKIGKGAKGGHYEKDKRLMFYLELSPESSRAEEYRKEFERPIMNKQEKEVRTVTGKSGMNNVLSSASSFASAAGSIEEDGKIENEQQVIKHNRRGSYEDYEGFLDYALNSKHGYKIRALSYEEVDEDLVAFDEKVGVSDDSDEYSEPGLKEEVDNIGFDTISINSNELSLFESTSDNDDDKDEVEEEGEEIEVEEDGTYVEVLNVSDAKLKIYRNASHFDENYIYLSDSDSEKIDGLDNYLRDLDLMETKSNKYYYHSNPHSSQILERKTMRKVNTNLSARKNENQSRRRRQNIKTSNIDYTTLKKRVKKNIKKMEDSLSHGQKQRNIDDLNYDKSLASSPDPRLAIPREIIEEEEQEQGGGEKEQVEQKDEKKVETTSIESKKILIRKGKELIRFYSEMERLQQKKHIDLKNSVQDMYLNLGHWQSLAFIIQFLLLTSICISVVYLNNYSGMSEDLAQYNTFSRYSSEQFIDLGTLFSAQSMMSTKQKIETSDLQEENDRESRGGTSTTTGINRRRDTGKGARQLNEEDSDPRMNESNKAVTSTEKKGGDISMSDDLKSETQSYHDENEIDENKTFTSIQHLDEGLGSGFLQRDEL